MPKVCPVCGTSYTDANIFCPADGSTLHAAESAGDLIGTVVADRYLVTDLLGAGGMGTVYLAQHVRLPQRAAIKVLRPEMVRDAGAVARFNREAANASRIEHERIARVFDFGETSDGTVYLAMEFVPGRTLKQIIAADGALSPTRTATITRQVADALDAAHRLGIVHRDLKPDNVMVIEDAAEGDRCKVVDFGIAKAVGGGGGEPGLTKTGFIVGTPEFMSPEQLFGSDIDHRSDVYALALVAYQCLTGALPFDTSTPERTMTARLTESPQGLAAVRPEVAWPTTVQAVFDRGLARDREARHESAGAFARDLADAIATWSSGEAAPKTAAPKLVDSSVANGQSHWKADATQQRETPTRGANRGVLIGGAVVVAVAAIAFVLLQGGGDSTGESRSGGPASGGLPVVTPAPAEPSPAVDTAEPPAETRDGVSGSVAVAPPSTTGSVDRGVTPSNQAVPTTPAEPTPPPVSAEPRRTSAAALYTLDSIRQAVNPATATPADARRSLAALRDLMPRLATAEDSAWGYLRQAEAHFLMGDGRLGCLTLETALPLLRTQAQRNVHTSLSPFC
jgi:eukaryotic-like serine/threonine-protein kinase